MSTKRSNRTVAWIMEMRRAEDEAKRKWPEWVHKLSDAVENSGLSMAAVTYPSTAARIHELGNNYLAISCQGMLSLLFEVVSLEGGGELRYHDLWHDHTEGDKVYPSAESKQFHARNVFHGASMTFLKLMDLWKECVDEQILTEHLNLLKAMS